MNKPKVIAFYLPQYHPTPDNDKWWGKGFTEWTNVGKAKPLFRGHYQPKVPADLGYYDLRLPEVREAQAELAKEAGIYGFCYYHYWFGNGKEELELPFNEVLKSGKPDFPFMLCWANESWHKKFWNKDGNGISKEVLIEQTYPGEQDIIDHFNRLLPAFKDPRYIRIEDKPVFMIYKPFEHPQITTFIKTWQKLAKESGLPGIFFVAQHQETWKHNLTNKILSLNFDMVNTVRLFEAAYWHTPWIIRGWNKLIRSLFRHPLIRSYKSCSKYFFNEEDKKENIAPTIIPNWDHTPRSGLNGLVLDNDGPTVFAEYASKVIKSVSRKGLPIVFLKSWNEWGEGNYIEPDLKYGKGYIKELGRLMESLDK